MEKALMKATKLLPKAMAGDTTAIAILLTLGFGYLLEQGINALKARKVISDILG